MGKDKAYAEFQNVFKLMLVAQYLAHCICYEFYNGLRQQCTVYSISIDRSAQDQISLHIPPIHSALPLTPSRLAGAAGFQLINVNAVPLALGGWSTSTQLASRKALSATLTRHYRDEFIKEAHKVSILYPKSLRR